MISIWWRPLVGLSPAHIQLIRREGILEALNERAAEYRAAGDAAGDDLALRRECMRRAALLRECFVALDQAAG